MQERINRKLAKASYDFPELLDFAAKSTPSKAYDALQRLQKRLHRPGGPFPLSLALKVAYAGTKSLQFEPWHLGWKYISDAREISHIAAIYKRQNSSGRRKKLALYRIDSWLERMSAPMFFQCGPDQFQER